MPTLNKETLWAKDSMRDGYRPKMLLYVLDKLFYIYVQVKNSRRADDKLVLAYEILYISANCCTNRRNGIEKASMPDALALLNVEDVRHLKCLAWAVYDGVLMVGPQPELSGDCPWCAVLAGLQQHIYRDCDGMAHCLPQMLSPPVHCVMRWEDNGHCASAEGRLECSVGSLGQQTGYRVDVGEEEEMLETVNPT